MAGKSIQALAWVDAETTGIPTEHDEVIDYSGVHVLEFALIVTDLDLNPLAGYHEVVKMTTAAADALKQNEYVRNMHMKNNLIRDAIKSPDAITLEQLDQELIKTIEQAPYDPGEFAIAGSGVARFDHPLVKAKLPLFARKLHYAEFDTGYVRRASIILAGEPVINDLPASYRDDVKTHRAWDDVQAHIEEAKRFRKFFRDAVAR